jgi:hypothetical protein
VEKSKIAHRTRGRANVEGIARIYQDDAQIFEFCGNRQAMSILRQQFSLAIFDGFSSAQEFALPSKPFTASPILDHANVKNLSNLDRRGQNRQKRCKLFTLRAFWGNLRLF